MTTINPQVQAVLEAYARRDKSLVIPGSTGTDPSIRSGNSWSAAFWAGYDGLTWGPRVPTRSMIAWGWYAAGRRAKTADTRAAKKAAKNS